MKKIYLGFIIGLLFIFSGCSFIKGKGEEITYETKNPDAEEVLTLEPDANIFQHDNTVYQTNIDWVDELTVTKDEQVGEIKKKNETDTTFENEMSNILPVGTKIYSTKERDDILIVEFNGETLKYLALVEG